MANAFEKYQRKKIEVHHVCNFMVGNAAKTKSNKSLTSIQTVSTDQEIISQAGNL